MPTAATARLVSRSASALFFGAGAVTIVNSFAANALGVAGLHVNVLRLFGMTALVSGIAVRWLLARVGGRPVSIGVALWGLFLLVGSAAWGGSITTSQAPAAVPVFMMVVLVWLGLTSPRWTAAWFSPVTVAACGFLATVPGSRLDFGGATMVVIVSTVVAETIAWAMTELARREELLELQAQTDPLTGLWNRAALTESLDICCARRERVVLAFVDLNGFKDVNDTFGHQIGDELLVEVGRRLQRIARPADLVARFGGDEFVVLFRFLPPGIVPGVLVDRIRAVLDEPWPSIAPAQVTASVGMVEGAEGARTPEELLRAADTAMYSRKHGTAADGSTSELSSRSLAYYRAAIEGLGGGFSVIRRCEGPDGAPDWLMIAANGRVRAEYRTAVGEPVGRRWSELERVADYSGLTLLYERARGTRRRQEQEIEIVGADGTRRCCRAIVVPVDADTVTAVTWDVIPEKEIPPSSSRQPGNGAPVPAVLADRR